MFGTKKESKPEVITGITPEACQAILQDAGYKAQLAEGASGNKFIKSALNGVNFQVYFYGTPEGSDVAKSLQFVVIFKGGEDRETLLRKVNEWNKRKRFLKAYADDDNDLCFDMDVAVDKGVTEEQIADYVDWLGVMLGGLKDVF